MESPYRGLVPYSDSPEDVRLFFGRDTERRVLIDNITTTRLSVVYGESGVGKSSVLYAGVVPKLRADPESLVIIYNTWFVDPAAGLVQAIRAAAQERSAEIPTDSVARALGRLVEITDRRALVILDQFEEYFQYHGGESGASSFAEQFPAAVLDPMLDANFLLSIRSDSLASLDFFKSRIPHLLANRIALRHLTRQGAVEAIERPLKAYNEDAPEGERIHLEEKSDLAQKIIEQTGRKPEDAQDPEAREVPATYLQLVLTRLWQRERELKSSVLRAATLASLGGGERIYEEYFSATIGRELDFRQQLVAVDLFKYLSTPTGRKIITSDKELSLYDELKKKDLRPILQKLSKARILVTVPPPPGVEGEGQVYYQFAHDVLARAARQWRVGRAASQKLAVKLLRWGGPIAAVLLILVLWSQHTLSNDAVVARIAEIKQSEEAVAATSQFQQLQKSIADRPIRAGPDPVAAPPDEVLGIDVSKFSPAIDWQTVKGAHISFVYVRASQGTSLIDNRFTQQWQAARNAGIRRGAFHVYRANQDPVQQARFFLGVVGTIDPADLPPALDLSTPGRLGTSDLAPLNDGIMQWLQEVEKAVHRKPVVYAPTNTLDAKLASAGYPLWCAQYGGAPGLKWKWTFWQYTASGRVDGVSGVIDVNRFNGSHDDFAKFR